MLEVPYFSADRRFLAKIFNAIAKKANAKAKNGANKDL
jgi:hypothetical protein